MHFPPSHTYWRSPRVRLADVNPVVLRLADGRHHRAKLETVSLTGGLLSMPNVLNGGSRIKLMFMSPAGPVLGSAEMLIPVSASRQAFRFVALEESDQRRLRRLIQTLLDPAELVWVEKYRAALHRKPAQRGVSRVVFGSFTLLALVGGAIYLLNTYFLK